MSESRIKRDIEIKVSKGNEYRTLIMDIYNENDFFYDAFTKAAAVVTEIVHCSNMNTSKVRNNTGDVLAYKSADEFDDPDRQLISNYPNNILPFCAERGQGKTSAMLSVSRALREIGSCNNKQVEFWNRKEVNPYFDPVNPVLNTRFEVLDPIDPTMMEKSDSIIKNVISKMFKTAEYKWERYIKGNFYNKHDKDFDAALKEKMLSKFVECFRAVDHLNKDDVNSSTSYDDLHMLAEYGDSTNFKQSLSELVELYLKFTDFGSNQSNAVLVIQIDDADLNIKNAHAISEEIRKYFVMPDVLVLMALNTETMRFTIEQYFLSQYKDYAFYDEKVLIKAKCHDIMEKYIEKLLPSSHRVYIPKVDDFIRDSFNRIKLRYVEYKNGRMNGEPTDLLTINENLITNRHQKDYYQEKLITLIYLKTGIILVKPKYYLHTFLPSSMRMLNHFMTLISDMDDVIKYENGEAVGTIDYIFKLIKESSGEQASDFGTINNIIEKYLANLKRFFDYFKYSWCPMTLDDSQLEIINIISKTSRGRKNQRTLELLENYIRGIDENSGNEKSSKDFIPFSAIVSKLLYLRSIDNPQKHLNFIFAVEMYYTIYFHMMVFECLKSWLRASDEERKKTSPFTDLVKLLGYSIFPLEYYDEKRIRRVKIQNSEYIDIDQKAPSSIYRFFNSFLCKFIDVDTRLYKKGTILYDKSVIKPNNVTNKIIFSCDFSYFDVFRPIVSILDDDGFINDFLSSDDKFDSGIVSSALRIISNVDVQNMLYKKVFRKTEYNVNENSLFDSVSGLYNLIDLSVKNNCILNLNSIISEMLEAPKDRQNMFESQHFTCIVETRKDGSGKYKCFTSLYNMENTQKNKEFDRYRIPKDIISVQFKNQNQSITKTIDELSKKQATGTKKASRQKGTSKSNSTKTKIEIALTLPEESIKDIKDVEKK